MKSTLILSTYLVVTPVLAMACPAAPDHTAQTEAVLERLQQASDEVSAKIISNELWQYYADAPDDLAQEILDRGMERRAAWDLLSARDDFDRLVSYCPDYAEGYNQRAFVSFLMGDFGGALPDLERAIELNPRHMGALSGLAISLIGLGKHDEAQEALAAALEVNPWLPERALLETPPGEDL